MGGSFDTRVGFVQVVEERGEAVGGGGEGGCVGCEGRFEEGEVMGGCDGVWPWGGVDAAGTEGGAATKNLKRWRGDETHGQTDAVKL